MSSEIQAPSEVVWQIFADVERWPNWTASVDRVEPLDGRELAVGRRFAVSQPRFPRLVWEVTELDPGRSWTWVQRSLGSLTVARHEVMARGPDRTTVRQVLDQRGPLGLVVALVMRRLTRRYLELEANGLKAASEVVHRDASTA